MKTVAVVIVNWNGKEDTVACLTSLKRMRKNEVRFLPIVVDNGSTNDSVGVIHSAHPWATLVETGQNLGFTGGNNVGIRYALDHGADIVWLLNNDTIVDREVLAILPIFDDPSVGIAAPKVYFAAGHEYHKGRYRKADQGKVLWYGGGIIDWANMYVSHRGVDEVDHGQYDEVEETPFITGCSMFISREVLVRIGFLDDRFYLYLEDLDICLRAKNAGYKLFYFPKAKIWHVNAGSSGGPGNPLHEYYLTRNRILIAMRYAPLRTKLALLRESIRFVFSGSAVKRRAVVDAFALRWGRRYEPRKFTS